MDIENRLRELWEKNVAVSQVKVCARFAPDGIVDRNEFCNQKFGVRYVFILKEVNDLMWSEGYVKDGLRQFLKDGAPRNGGHTWGPVCRWMDAVDKESEDLEGSKYGMSRRSEFLKKIAAVNLKKIDTKKSSLDMNEIAQCYECEEIKDAFANQIREIVTDGFKGTTILVCCGNRVYDIVCGALCRQGTGEVRELNAQGQDGFRKVTALRVAGFGNCWLVDFYHPNAREKGLWKLFRRCVRDVHMASSNSKN